MNDQEPTKPAFMPGQLVKHKTTPTFTMVITEIRGDELMCRYLNGGEWRTVAFKPFELEFIGQTPTAPRRSFQPMIDKIMEAVTVGHSCPTFAAGAASSAQRPNPIDKLKAGDILELPNPLGNAGRIFKVKELSILGHDGIHICVTHSLLNGITMVFAMTSLKSINGLTVYSVR